jgi:hypothetical protein
MRCSNERHAVDVMPENAKMIDPDSGEEGFIIVRRPLDESGQHWGAEVQTIPGLWERNTRMSFTLAHDVSGQIAGIFWMHARKDLDGAEYHECWLPTSGTEEPIWTLLHVEPIELLQDVQCSCGQHGFIRKGRWVELRKHLTAV